MNAKLVAIDPKQHHDERLNHLWRRAPFALRITEWKALPIPVLVVKERHSINRAAMASPLTPDTRSRPQRGSLVERGRLSGEALRRCLPILRQMIARVRDEDGIPLDLQRYLTREGLKERVNLPLDEDVGAKFALIFRLQERLSDLDRVEIIARRVSRFTREEAVYWLSRMTSFGPDANRWAVAGLRLMLGGQSKDRAVERMLERLRSTC
jgi:hypothetical protein